VDRWWNGGWMVDGSGGWRVDSRSPENQKLGIKKGKIEIKGDLLSQ